MANNTKKMIVAFLVLAVMALGFTAALPSSSAASTSGPSGEFIFGTAISTSISDLNPLTVTNSLATIIAQEIYSDSLAFQWADGSLGPWLANSWTTSSNSTGAENVTFHLNTNAEWVQGTSVVGHVTAKDVVFTFDAIKANSSLDVYGIGPSLVSVTAWDNNSAVSFVFKDTSQLWLPYIATQTIIPSSWSSYDNGTPANIGSYTNMGPVGQEVSAGPFILQSITAEGATLIANTHFWMGTPHIESFYVEKFKSTSASTLALETGAVGGVVPSLSDYQALSNTANITNVNQIEPYTFYVWLNDSLPTYSNPHFRQGLTYAINKTQIMLKAEDGLGSWGNNFSFGGLPTDLKSYWAPGITHYSYNDTNALTQFGLAGYHLHANSSGPELLNNTTNKQLTITIEEPPVSDWQAAGTFIQADLKAIGINAVLLNVPFSTWGADVFGANFSVMTYFGYVPSFTNPYIQLQSPYDYNGGWNFEKFSNSSLNTLFNNTLNATGSTYTNDLNQMQKIIDYQVPLIPIGNANNYYAYNDKLVQGFLPNLTIDSPYNLMHITSSYTPPTTTSANNTLYYVIGGVVAAVIIVGGIVGYTLRGKKGKEEK